MATTDHRVRQLQDGRRALPTLLDGISDLMQSALLIAAERDRYRDALAAIAAAPYGEMSHWAVQRLAREALESRHS